MSSNRYQKLCAVIAAGVAVIGITGCDLDSAAELPGGAEPDAFLDTGEWSSGDPTGSTDSTDWLSPLGTDFHAEAHPPHWTEWTTDGAPALTSGARFLTQGLRCSGRYCDDVGLLSVESGYAHTNSWWTGNFSEEGTNYRVCEDNGFVTGLKCSGSYCDNLSLRCSQLDNGGVRTGCYWTAPISEESGGRFVAPESMYVAGMRCSGRYCDSKSLYLCQADQGGPSFDYAALAAEFAPRLRFDQQTGTGSGEQKKCFPSDPGTYFTQRAQGASAISLCNQDYAPIANNQVPTYYIAKRVGTNAVIIRYWYFYAWQSTCFSSFGSHAADWESMAVLIIDGQLTRVAFSQHGGWYSREPGDFELVGGTHPVGYVGKNAHGTYHDDGGSGGCLYFEDFRNPGGNNYHMDTWNNLTELARGAGKPDWMNCTGSGCFDGVGHPIEQTGDVRSMGGCGKDGCDRSSVGGNMPFINDTTGAEYTAITAQHSGGVIDVPGASHESSAQLWQYTDLGVDNQRWLFESTGDGYFTIRARHSQKCIDVAGGSQSAGAGAIQYSCGGGSNQRFRLTSESDGHFSVQAKHSGQCLNIAGAALEDGAAVQQEPCTGALNQRFSFAP
ncbi:MAG: hypothetical protein Tsb0020_07550 [Haliangiales bacterium]